MDTRVMSNYYNDVIGLRIEKEERKKRERGKRLNVVCFFLHLVLLLTKFLRTSLIFAYNYPYAYSLSPLYIVTLHQFQNTEIFIKHLTKLFTPPSTNGYK